MAWEQSPLCKRIGAGGADLGDLKNLGNKKGLSQVTDHKLVDQAFRGTPRVIPKMVTMRLAYDLKRQHF